MKGNSSVWKFGKREKQVKLERDDKWDACMCDHKNITMENVMWDAWTSECTNIWVYWHVKCIENIGLSYMI